MRGDQGREHVPEDRRVLERPGPEPGTTVTYGDHPDQVIDVYLPESGTTKRPTVAFLHGGYWRPAYDRHHARSAAAGLAEAGHPTALIEYRRIPGDPDGMLADVRRAITGIAEGRTPLPGGPVIVIGHSAGGHLALLAAHEEHVAGCLALAPVADLEMAESLHLDDDAVRSFLDRPAEERPDLDPARCGSPPCPVAVLHGESDTLAPIALSQSYTSATGTRLVRLPGTGHFELIDPRSAAWTSVITELGRVAGASGIE